MAIGAILQLKMFDFKPSAPPSGSVIFYVKTDNIIYVQDSLGNEYPFASADLITQLSGDVTAVGPGNATAVVVYVGGKTAAEIAQSVTDTQAATSANTFSVIMKRDASGNVFVTNINGVAPEAHATRHLPTGADPITTAAPITNLNANLSNSVGSANSLSRSDHGHAIDTAAPVTQNADQANAAGSSASLARADHVHNIPTAAPATDLTATTTNDQGSASTLAKSDHSHKIDTAAASTQTPNQANAVGTSTNLARADHVHNIPTAAPVSDLTASTSNSDGSAASFSRSDHGHAIDTAAPVTQNADQANAAGSSASLARADHVHNIPTAAPVTQTPDQANADGSATSFSRSDHVHDIPSGTPVQIGTSNNAGAAASFALSDHVHNHGNQTNTSLHALATGSAHGFQSSTDKAKSDAELPAALGTANQVLGVNNAATAGEYKSLVGTTNQIAITDSVGSKIFSTPQDIATSSQPTFAGENLTDRLQLTEQVVPSTPASTKIDVFAELSNGFTRLRALDSSGIKSTILRDTLILVKNTTGSTIGSGKPVYYTGADVSTNLPLVALAKADSSTTVPCIGLTIESIVNNGVGRVIALGIVNNIDTSAFSQGDKLYLSATTAGGLTNVKPTSPSNIWQRIGIVLVSNVSTGAIEVRPFATHGEESGTNTGFTLNTFALTDGATITLDASKGNVFTVTLAGNRTLAAPTNPTDGQKITLRVTQDATGGRSLAFDSIFRFGLDILSVVLSTGANKTDYIGCQYNAAASKWDVLAVSKGF